jgi:hypothetical protein
MTSYQPTNRKETIFFQKTLLQVFLPLCFSLFVIPLCFSLFVISVSLKYFPDCFYCSLFHIFPKANTLMSTEIWVELHSPETSF